MISLQLILLLVFVIKFVGFIFIGGIICGLIPPLGDFLRGSIGIIFDFGETIGSSIKKYKGDKKDGKSGGR